MNGHLITAEGGARIDTCRPAGRCNCAGGCDRHVQLCQMPAPRWTPQPAIWIYHIPLARRAARALRNLFTTRSER